MHHYVTACHSFHISATELAWKFRPIMGARQRDLCRLVWCNVVKMFTSLSSRHPGCEILVIIVNHTQHTDKLLYSSFFFRWRLTFAHFLQLCHSNLIKSYVLLHRFLFILISWVIEIMYPIPTPINKLHKAIRNRTKGKHYYFHQKESKVKRIEFVIQ